jgi:predicted adenylyl cyclase CyaB
MNNAADSEAHTPGMSQNVEIKVAVADLEGLRVVIERIGARWSETQDQVDRYYVVAGTERIKLRTINGGAAQMIRYTRPETAAARTSTYEITPVRDDDGGQCLVPKGPPVVTVRKRRGIWLRDNVRFHLDHVDELGTFLELEAVVDALHDEAACRAQVDEIVAALGLDPATFIRASYADVITAS